MTIWIWRVGLGLAAYLLGAVPSGYLVARARGVDIRTVGSRNIGATNVFRCVGKGWGIFTFILDVLKGFVPAFFFPMILAKAGSAPEGVLTALPGLGFMVLAIAGHNWPVYLGPWPRSPRPWVSPAPGGGCIAMPAGFCRPCSPRWGCWPFCVTRGISRDCWPARKIGSP